MKNEMPPIKTHIDAEANMNDTQPSIAKVDKEVIHATLDDLSSRDFLDEAMARLEREQPLLVEAFVDCLGPIRNTETYEHAVKAGILIYETLARQAELKASNPEGEDPTTA